MQIYKPKKSKTYLCQNQYGFSILSEKQIEILQNSGCFFWFYRKPVVVLNLAQRRLSYGDKNGKH